MNLEIKEIDYYNESDWEDLSQLEKGNTISEWQTYRQALRDLPSGLTYS